jgi:hypothetical protein
MNAGHLTTRHAGHANAARVAFLVAMLVLGVVAALGVATMVTNTGPTDETTGLTVPVQPPIARTVDLRAARGEFLLSPGNQEPVGILVRSFRPMDLSPARGEFFLSPGNVEPVGILARSFRPIDPVDIGFGLAPGLNQPPGQAQSER